MGSINHDEILRKYLKEFINNNYLSCYLHDLFKSIIVRVDKREETVILQLVLVSKLVNLLKKCAS